MFKKQTAIATVFFVTTFICTQHTYAMSTDEFNTLFNVQLPRAIPDCADQETFKQKSPEQQIIYLLSMVTIFNMDTDIKKLELQKLKEKNQRLQSTLQQIQAGEIKAGQSRITTRIKGLYKELSQQK